MNLDFLINKRAAVLARAEEIVQRAETDQRAMNAEELQAHADALSEVAGIDATLRARDAQVAAEVAAAQPAQAARAAVPGQTEQAVRGRERVTATDEYREAYEQFVRTGVAPAELRAHTVATDTAGGYLVPDSWYNEIVRKLREFNVMRQYATIIPSMMGTINIPVETSTGTANWTAEGIGYNEAEDVFGNVTLSPWKMTRLVKVSEELLADGAFDLGAYLANTFASAFADLEEAAFIDGDDSSKPKGIIRSTTLGTTASATNAITFDNLADLYHSVKPAYRQRGVWIMNDATRKELSKIKTGVASDLRYLWTESLATGAPATLFGRPVISASNMPTLATAKKVVIFGDLSYYYIAERPGLGLTRLNELYAANGLVGFVGNRRVDAELTQAEAVKHLITA